MPCPDCNGPLENYKGSSYCPKCEMIIMGKFSKPKDEPIISVIIKDGEPWPPGLECHLVEATESGTWLHMREIEPVSVLSIGSPVYYENFKVKYAIDPNFSE